MSNVESGHYTPVAKFLHWLVAGMIVVQFILAQLADNAASDLRELALLANHKSVGITILAIAFVRIIWRFRNPPPALPTGMSQWQVTASHVSHWSLYALLFLLPITGWLMSSATAYSVSWFGLVQLPDFIGPDPAVAETLEEVHEVLGYVLLVIASVHIIAALKHHFLDKDDVLLRIASALGVFVFVLVATLGTAWLGTAGSRSGEAGSTVAAGGVAVEESSQSELPVWDIDYDASYIRFIGDQAGAEFDGVWESWTASLQFSADDLGGSRFDVTIDTTSGNTEDVDRDTTLSDPEWFDTKNFPEAYFRASRFSAAPEGGFVADGQLIIKDVATPVKFLFDVESDGDARTLTGTAELDRIALGVGTGEWDDTEWIGQYVRVEVRVEATTGM